MNYESWVAGLSWHLSSEKSTFKCVLHWQFYIFLYKIFKSYPKTSSPSKPAFYQHFPRFAAEFMHSISIEYQEPLEIYMKGNKTDESNFITNSNQSEITLLEDTLLGDTILKDTAAATVLKIYKLLQRMTNKNV